MIQVNTVDANGIILGSYDYKNGAAVNDGKIDYTIETTQGYIDQKDKLFLYEKGNTATVKATYHTYKYENGQEVGTATVTVTITADDQAIVDTDKKFTYAAFKPYNWDKATLTDKVIMGEPVGLQMFVKDSSNNPVIDGSPCDAGYAVESANKDIVYTVGNMVYPNKVGSTTLNVTMNGKIIWQLPVNVVDAAKINSFSANKNTVTISNATQVAAKAVFEFEAKDQYGRKLDATGLSGNYVITCINAPAAGATKATDTAATGYINNLNFATSNTSPKVAFEFYGTEGNAGATSTVPGTYNYKVELKDSNNTTVYTQTVSVVVKAVPTGATEYKVLLNGEATTTTIDSTVTADSYGAQTLDIKVGKFVGGVLSDYVTVSQDSIKITKSNGAGVATAASITDKAGVATITATDVTSVAFAVRTTNSAAKTYLIPSGATAKSDFTVDTGSKGAFETASADTYTVTATVSDGGRLHSVAQKFVVKNSQPQITVSKRANTNVVTAGATDKAIIAAFKFNYDGLEYSTDAADIMHGKIDENNIIGYEHINDQLVNNGTEHLTFIKSVTISVPVVIGDLNANGSADKSDVVYITQTVPCGYWLQWK